MFLTIIFVNALLLFAVTVSTIYMAYHLLSTGIISAQIMGLNGHRETSREDSRASPGSC